MTAPRTPIDHALAAQPARLADVCSLTRGESNAPEPVAHVCGVDFEGTADALERKQRVSVRARNPPVHLARRVTLFGKGRAQASVERDEGFLKHGQHQTIRRTGSHVQAERLVSTKRIAR